MAPPAEKYLDTPDKKTVVIVGGYGYPSYHLALRLAHEGHAAVVFDLRRPPAADQWRDAYLTKHGLDESDLDLTFFSGSVCSPSDLDSCLSSHGPVDAVVHSAAIGISGADVLPAFDDKVEAVNLQGTRNVIEVVKNKFVPALVFTSTTNVVFARHRPILYGTEENTPYAGLLHQTDQYSRTKQVAEELVLANSSKLLSDGKTVLHTCALRPSGMYGPGEQRITPRAIAVSRQGPWARFGHAFSSRQDMVHVDNVVQAHAKAVSHLLDPEKRQRLSGQAYFVTDDHPVNTYKFIMGNVNAGIHSDRPGGEIEVPLWIVLAFAYLLQFAAWLLGDRFRMPLSGAFPTEIYKSGVTHYFSVEKARRDFGYDPEEKWGTESWAEIYRSHGLRVPSEVAKKDHNDNLKDTPADVDAPKVNDEE